MATENTEKTEATPVAAKPSGRVTQDPFSTQNPYVILARLPGDDDFPEGYVLSWINPNLRNSNLGWQGWKPIEFGDRFAGEHGEGLRGYIADLPYRTGSPDSVDNYVRRRDTILAYLPAIWYDQRQAKAADESRALVEGLAVPEGTKILPNVTMVGGGLQTDENPTFGRNTPEDKALGSLVRRHKQR